jgi:FAD:protein FMN transferase
MARVARILLPASIALATACAPGPEIETDRFFALGTVVELRFYNLGASERAAAGAHTRQILDAARLRWSASDPDSELFALNRSLIDSGFADPSDDLATDLRSALDIAERSGGRFDPALGALVRAWGFHENQRPPGPPPAATAIAALVADPLDRPFYRRIDWDGGTINAPPGVTLDFGGFAKGLAAAEVATVLRERGVADAIINLGGDLVVLGSHGPRAWRIAIRDPASVRAIASLEAFDGEAVFTSGDYERGFDHDGRRYHHILDPSTGYPTQGLSSVTVVHPDAGLADAAATALLVAGPDGWRALADELEIDLVLTITPDGAIAMSDGMASRVTLEVDDANR